MPHLVDESIYCSPFTPVASLDQVLGSGQPNADDGQANLLPDIVSPAPTPEQTRELTEICDAVAAFVAGLPERQREIATRVYWHGESCASVARDLRISKAAVSQALGRVIRHGRCELAAYRASTIIQ